MTEKPAKNRFLPQRLIGIIQQKLEKFSMPDYTLFSIYAIITGALVGLAAVLFHESIEFLRRLFFEHSAKSFSSFGAALVIIIPAIGMIIQSIMIYLAPKTAKRRSVPEVIKAVATRGGYIPFRTTMFHFLAPVISMGSGATVGPEGPAAQLGGGVASKLGQFLFLTDSRRRMFTAAGAGAAISAVFNTPLGGVFFALEIILLNDFQTATFSALILASVSASAVSRIFLGDNPAFQFAIPDVGHYDQYYIFVIVGILAGLISIAYINYSESVSKLFRKKQFKKIPQWLSMAAIGLIVGICGYFYNDIFGIGYAAINKVLAKNLTWQIAAVLLVMKFILVPIILHSGGFGGVFAPSLFMGAMFGYIFSTAVNSVWGLNLDTTTFVLVSMGAVLGGINSIPISAILIIFEMTKEYSFILPLMLSVIISTMLVQLVIKGSIHTKHLEREGYNLSSGREMNLLGSILVKEAMTPGLTLIKAETDLPKLVAQLLNSPHSVFYTVNDDGKIIGTITENELRPIITEYDSLREMVVASDIARPEVIFVNEDDTLEKVFKLFEKTNLDQFPVLSGEDGKQVVGTIRRHDAMTAYNRASLKYNITDGLANELRSLEKFSISKVADGYSILEKKAPVDFVGKSLAELKIRNKFGLEVLMIKTKKSFLEDDDEDITFPEATYRIKADDTLVLFGSDDKISSIDLIN
ncbi:MAG: chloride channel protein [Melioribacteraceae bacterium]|nr:chloride channel protein [Melioribacteraceae bacterium]